MEFPQNLIKYQTFEKIEITNMGDAKVSQLGEHVEVTEIVTFRSSLHDGSELRVNTVKGIGTSQNENN